MGFKILFRVCFACELIHNLCKCVLLVLMFGACGFSTDLFLSFEKWQPNFIIWKINLIGGIIFC